MLLGLAEVAAAALSTVVVALGLEGAGELGDVVDHEADDIVALLPLEVLQLVDALAARLLLNKLVGVCFDDLLRYVDEPAGKLCRDPPAWL